MVSDVVVLQSLNAADESKKRPESMLYFVGAPPVLVITPPVPCGCTPRCGGAADSECSGGEGEAGGRP